MSPMAKQELNAFDVLVAVRELRALVGARFDKAFQPTREEVILRLRVSRRMRGGATTTAVSGGGEEGDAFGGGGDVVAVEGNAVAAADVLPGETSKVEVAIGVGRYVCITEFPRDMPQDPTQFAMTLRKHLSGARLNSVRQQGFDRVIEMELSKKDGNFLLVMEFFHDGNVILVRDGRIVTALLQQSWATREVRPGAEFRPPPPRADPKVMDLAEFRSRFRASQADAVRTLATELNMGGTWAQEVCARAGVDKNAAQADVSEAELERIYDELQGALRDVEDGLLDPVTVRKGEEKVDVSPVPLAEHDGLDLERHPTFMAAVDRYFSKAVTVERVDPRLKRLDEEKTKVRRMYDAQKAAIERFERDAEVARVKGDVLYAHFDTVQKLSARLIKAAKEFGWKEVQAQLKGARSAGQAYAELVESLNPHEAKGTFRLPDMDGRSLRVTVDLRKSVQDNANDQYALSKKLRDKLEGARVAFSQTQEKLRDIEGRGVKIVESVERERAKAKPTKRLWFESYRWFYSSDGNLVLAGRDASSNEKLVKKHLDDQDRYLHADVSGAPSLVAKASDGGISERTLEEAAQFAVAMSRAWAAGVGAGEAYWVTPTQVSKTPNPGEYVAKGAFIIRGKRNYLRVPLRLAVGEVEVEGVRKVMCGPVDAVRARSRRFLVVEPGRQSKNALANRLASAFDVPVEEVQRVLPPGDVTVVEERL